MTATNTMSRVWLFVMSGAIVLARESDRAEGALFDRAFVSIGGDEYGVRRRVTVPKEALSMLGYLRPEKLRELDDDIAAEGKSILDGTSPPWPSAAAIAWARRNGAA